MIHGRVYASHPGMMRNAHLAEVRTNLFRQWTAGWIILVAMGTALSPFVLSDQRNVLSILVAALALPIVVLLRIPVRNDLGWAMVSMSYLIVVELFYGRGANYSSLGYTGMFILTYIAFCGTLYSGAVTRERLLMLLRRLIQGYAIVSVFQLFCSKVGLPVPNHILSKEAWSYNSLGVEPSHTARALAFMLLAYLILVRGPGPAPTLKALWERERSIIVPFSVSLLLTGSSLAVAIFPLTIVMALKLRWLFISSVLLVFIWPFLQLVEVDSIRRVVAFLTALPSMDIMAMVQADHSGALRVMPLIIFLQSASLGEPSVWFGGGYEAISHYIQGNLIGVAKDVAVAGFIPGYVMICGILGTVLFCHAFLFRFMNRNTLPLILMWFPILANSAWNSQIFWFTLVLLRAVHYFSRASWSSASHVAGRGGL
ncbi:signal transduction histidine kinase [Agrobacterium pusense]|uniref:hypothetical protein n=1 Tax=Agrobacterium pusense TaxID=648995 RepID=UPI0028598AE8|nr:hypothetical protein [Agrobacterium pusense]MDR6192736.1 signal transduction histidine kinase [Agrobacterium pusense]